MKLNLCLHTGGAIATRDDVFAAPAPTNTATYAAVSHRAFIERIERTLAGENITVIQSQFALAKNGERFFGLMEVQLPGLVGGTYGRVLGLRNSYDKSCPVGLTIGTAPFVCDNLAFNGDIVVMHRHTPKVYSKLPGMLIEAVSRLPLVFGAHDKRVAAYQGRELTQAEADHAILELWRHEALSPTDIYRVAREYAGVNRDEAGNPVPRHAEFAPRNAWSLFNAATEVLKNADSKGQYRPNLWDLHGQSKGLHSVFDRLCAVDIAAELVPAQDLN